MANQPFPFKYGSIPFKEDANANDESRSSGESMNYSSPDLTEVEDVSTSPVRMGWNYNKLAVLTSVVLVLIVYSVRNLAYDPEDSYVSLLQSSSSGESFEKEENTPHFYNKALVNNFPGENEKPAYWSHRYYKSTKYFKGAGSPIFLVVGGEGALNNGMLYPFVTEVLAKKFGAAVVQPEHRFYGPYPPVRDASVDQLLELLTPAQAMADMIRLVQDHLKHTEFKDCSPDRSSPDYCPLITIGGSYPGFLSAMFRFLHPDVVDAAYASAAPLLMYAQITDNNAYYDIVTAAADHASPGCAHAVKQTLADIVDEIHMASSVEEAAARVGVCVDTLPKSVKTKEDLSQTIVNDAVYAFANYNMNCYPPSPNTGLYKVCQAFQDPEMDSIATLKSFFNAMMIQEYEEENECDLKYVTCDPPAVELEIIREKNDGRTCYSLETDEEENESGGDVYDGFAYNDGYFWNFQTCTNLIFLAGQSKISMFPVHNATYEELTADCQSQFGTTPRPWELVQKWGFDDLVGNGASRILFTNGMQDMWSGGSILTNLSDTVLALNFENGAHHSDLNHHGPSDEDTDDIKQGYKDIETILGRFIDEIKAEGSQ